MEDNNHLCSQHRRNIKFYCTKHDVPCCDKCVSTYHNTCDDILSEEDLCNIKHSAEADELKDEICDFRHDFNALERSFSEIENVLNEEKKDVLNEIKIFKSKAEKMFNHSLEKIDNETSDTCQRIKEELHTDYNKIKEVGDVLKRCDERKLAENKFSNMEYFLAMKAHMRIIEEARKDLKSLASQNWLNDVILTFSPNPNILKLLSKESIGKVSTITDRGPFLLKQNTVNKAQVVLKQTKNEVTKGRENIRPRIVRKKVKLAKVSVTESATQKSVSTSDGKRIVLDKDNKNLVIYTHNGKFIGCVNLSIKPHAIYYIDDSTVRVSYGTPTQNITVSIPEFHTLVYHVNLFGFDINITFQSVCLICLVFLVICILLICGIFYVNSRRS